MPVPHGSIQIKILLGKLPEVEAAINALLLSKTLSFNDVKIEKDVIDADEQIILVIVYYLEKIPAK